MADMKKKPPITQATHQNNTRVSRAAVTHYWSESLISVKEEKAQKVQTPVRRKESSNVMLCYLAP